MSTNDEVKKKLAPGHKESDWSNHKDHADSKYKVISVTPQNCQYTYSATAGDTKANKTHLNDEPADDKPGGDNHMAATHPNGDPNQWNSDIETNGRQSYSGFTGKWDDAVITISNSVNLIHHQHQLL